MQPVSAYLLYAPQDLPIRNALAEHFSKLKRDGILDLWDESMAIAGEDVAEAKRKRLESAEIILLLISSDFLASDELDKQTNQALARRNLGAAQVVPIIARDCFWKTGALAALAPSPQGGNAINSRHFKDEDEALHQVANELFVLAKTLRGEKTAPRRPEAPPVNTYRPAEAPAAGGSNKMVVFTIVALVLLVLGWGSVQFLTGGDSPNANPDNGASTLTENGDKVSGGGQLLKDLKAGASFHFNNGKTEITLLSAKVEAAGSSDKLLKINIKVFYSGNINLGIGDGNFRLLHTDGPTPPENSFNTVVDANSTYKAELVFKVPSGTASAKLKIELGQESTEVPFDLTGASTPESNQHVPYPVSLSSNKIPFKSNKMDILEAQVFSYNAEQDELRLSVKYTYTGRYNDNLGNDQFRFKLPDDDQLAPMNIVNELVQPNAPVTVPVSFRFDKKHKKGQLILEKGDEKQVLEVGW